MGEGMEGEKRREPEASLFSTWQPSQKNTVIRYQRVSCVACFQCETIHTHSKGSLLLTTVFIHVKCHHIGCSGRLLALTLSMDDTELKVRLSEEAAGQVRQYSWDAS